MEFKDRLKVLRKAKKLTQEDLSKLVGVSPSSISMYEVGKRIPELETFEALADYFNVDMNYLKGKSDVRHSDDLSYYIPTSTDKIRIPILGSIHAGSPTTAIENVEGYEIVDNNNYNIDYALRVKGDSMINARINDGDIVYVTKDTDYKNGDVVIACINGDEATIKRFYQYGDKVILKPENPTMKEIEYNTHDVILLGKVVSARISL